MNTHNETPNLSARLPLLSWLCFLRQVSVAVRLQRAERRDP